jgi:putative transposase
MDITEHPTRSGKVYLAVVIDAWSRRVVGWSIADPSAPNSSRTQSRWRPGNDSRHETK